MAPFLAYKHLGDTFSWLLYGDDDTVFFIDAALEVVKAGSLDPHQPYFLTGWSPNSGTNLNWAI